MRARVWMLIRAVWSLSLTFACLLPLGSLLSQSDVALSVKLGLVALCVLAAVRPADALLGLTALLPLTLAFESFGSGISSTNLTECLLLVFAAGSLVRRTDGRATTDRLSAPALIFGLAIVASLAGELRAVQAITPARHVFAEVWAHVTRTYWTEPSDFDGLHLAVRWLAVLGLAVGAERALREQPERAPHVVHLWLTAGGAVALYGALRLAQVVASRPQPVLETLRWVVGNYRISAFHPDPNAAGSYFALVLVPAVIIAYRRRAWPVWAVVVPLATLGFVLAQSRAAAGGVLAAGGAYWLTHLPRRRRLLVGVVVCALGAALLAATLTLTRHSHASVGQAWQLRMQMTRVAGRIVARYPLFGVGVGDYVHASRRFMGEDMAALRQFAPVGENAHNNFLQVLAELGIPAFAAFLWLVVPMAWAVWTSARPDVTDRDLLSTGLCAFLLSALLGHPLLIFEVATMFFLTLGLTASALPVSARPSPWRWYVTAAGTAFFAAAIIFRLR